MVVSGRRGYNNRKVSSAQVKWSWCTPHTQDLLWGNILKWLRILWGVSLQYTYLKTLFEITEICLYISFLVSRLRKSDARRTKDPIILLEFYTLLPPSPWESDCHQHMNSGGIQKHWDVGTLKCLFVFGFFFGIQNKFFFSFQKLL